jgi:hypothetical protein
VVETRTVTSKRRGEAMALAVLGAWIGITVAMWFAAAGSFRTVDRVSDTATPKLGETTKPASREQARLSLRYLVSEINRTYFRAYGWAQLVLGAALFALLLSRTPRDAASLVLGGGMLALAAALTLYLTPEIVAAGRQLDFVPRDPAPPGMARFRTLHAAFTGLDGAKLLSGLALLVRLVWAR